MCVPPPLLFHAASSWVLQGSVLPWAHQPALQLTPCTPHQVQGAEEAQKERQRQKELESNYRRVWGSGGGEGTGDLDEFDF